MQERFNVVGFTLQQFTTEEIGRFFMDPESLQARLEPVKAAMGLDELMFLSTCNRSEFFFTADRAVDQAFLQQFFALLYPQWEAPALAWAVDQAGVWEGAEAVRHVFRVAASLESLVIGEREIITQVRQSYELNRDAGLTGDFLRMVIGKAVEAAKAVYTETEIARRPVSVVNLAFQQMNGLGLNPDNARVLLVGAGQTNRAIALKLQKHGYRHFTVANRTLANGEALANELGGQAITLADLSSGAHPFEVLITCTGSSQAVVNREVYAAMLAGDDSRKVVVDLAVPYDFDRSLTHDHLVQLIAIEDLKGIADANLKTRQQELGRCEAIIARQLEEFEEVCRIRQVELAMQAVPEKVKAIKRTAMDEVFAREIRDLDDSSRKVLEKVMTYMEKKYISEPMKMARQIMLDANQR